LKPELHRRLLNNKQVPAVSYLHKTVFILQIYLTQNGSRLLTVKTRRRDLCIYCNLSTVYCSKNWSHSREASLYLNDSLFSLIVAATGLYRGPCVNCKHNLNCLNINIKIYVDPPISAKIGHMNLEMWSIKTYVMSYHVSSHADNFVTQALTTFPSRSVGTWM
jgi:hypothetical protein